MCFFFKQKTAYAMRISDWSSVVCSSDLRWLTLLAGGGASIFAVGDDDQSIYAFRGANVGNMSDFERDYAHGNVIRLEQNYRSYGHILDSANALIAQNTGRLGNNLCT